MLLKKPKTQIYRPAPKILDIPFGAEKTRS